MNALSEYSKFENEESLYKTLLVLFQKGTKTIKENKGDCSQLWNHLIQFIQDFPDAFLDEYADITKPNCFFKIKFFTYEVLSLISWEKENIVQNSCILLKIFFDMLDIYYQPQFLLNLKEVLKFIEYIIFSNFCQDPKEKINLFIINSLGLNFSDLTKLEYNFNHPQSCFNFGIFISKSTTFLYVLRILKLIWNFNITSTPNSINVYILNLTRMFWDILYTNNIIIPEFAFHTYSHELSTYVQFYFSRKFESLISLIQNSKQQVDVIKSDLKFLENNLNLFRDSTNKMSFFTSELKSLMLSFFNHFIVEDENNEIIICCQLMAKVFLQYLMLNKNEIFCQPNGWTYYTRLEDVLVDKFTMMCPELLKLLLKFNYFISYEIVITYNNNIFRNPAPNEDITEVLTEFFALPKNLGAQPTSAPKNFSNPFEFLVHLSSGATLNFGDQPSSINTKVSNRHHKLIILLYSWNKHCYWYTFMFKLLTNLRFPAGSMNGELSGVAPAQVKLLATCLETYRKVLHPMFNQESFYRNTFVQLFLDAYSQQNKSGAVIDYVRLIGYWVRLGILNCYVTRSLLKDCGEEVFPAQVDSINLYILIGYFDLFLKHFPNTLMQALGREDSNLLSSLTNSKKKIYDGGQLHLHDIDRDFFTSFTIFPAIYAEERIFIYFNELGRTTTCTGSNFATEQECSINYDLLLLNIVPVMYKQFGTQFLTKFNERLHYILRPPCKALTLFSKILCDFELSTYYFRSYLLLNFPYGGDNTTSNSSYDEFRSHTTTLSLRALKCFCCCLNHHPFEATTTLVNNSLKFPEFRSTYNNDDLALLNEVIGQFVSYTISRIELDSDSCCNNSTTVHELFSSLFVHCFTTHTSLANIFLDKPSVPILTTLFCVILPKIASLTITSNTELLLTDKIMGNLAREIEKLWLNSWSGIDRIETNTDIDQNHLSSSSSSRDVAIGNKKQQYLKLFLDICPVFLIYFIFPTSPFLKQQQQPLYTELYVFHGKTFVSRLVCGLFEIATTTGSPLYACLAQTGLNRLARHIGISMYELFQIYESTLAGIFCRANLTTTTTFLDILTKFSNLLTCPPNLIQTLKLLPKVVMPETLRYVLTSRQDNASLNYQSQTQGMAVPAASDSFIYKADDIFISLINAYTSIHRGNQMFSRRSNPNDDYFYQIIVCNVKHIYAYHTAHYPELLEKVETYVQNLLNVPFARFIVQDSQNVLNELVVLLGGHSPELKPNILRGICLMNEYESHADPISPSTKETEPFCRSVKFPSSELKESERAIVTKVINERVLAVLFYFDALFRKTLVTPSPSIRMAYLNTYLRSFNAWLTFVTGLEMTKNLSKILNTLKIVTRHLPNFLGRRNDDGNGTCPLAAYHQSIEKTLQLLVEAYAWLVNHINPCVLKEFAGANILMTLNYNDFMKPSPIITTANSDDKVKFYELVRPLNRMIIHKLLLLASEDRSTPYGQDMNPRISPPPPCETFLFYDSAQLVKAGLVPHVCPNRSYESLQSSTCYKQLECCFCRQQQQEDTAHTLLPDFTFNDLISALLTGLQKHECPAIINRLLRFAHALVDSNSTLILRSMGVDRDVATTPIQNASGGDVQLIPFLRLYMHLFTNLSSNTRITPDTKISSSLNRNKFNVVASEDVYETGENYILSARILGTIGAIDPDKLATAILLVPPHTPNLIGLDTVAPLLKNRREACQAASVSASLTPFWETDVFTISILSKLFKAYLNASDARRQDCFAYALQEIVALFGNYRDWNDEDEGRNVLTPQTTQLDDNFWRKLPENLRENLEPFRHSHYKMTKAAPPPFHSYNYPDQRQTPASPIPLLNAYFPPSSNVTDPAAVARNTLQRDAGKKYTNLFERWLVNWVGSLIRVLTAANCSTDPNNVDDIMGENTNPVKDFTPVTSPRLCKFLTTCSFIFKYNVQMARCLLPVAVINLILSSREKTRVYVLAELNAILIHSRSSSYSPAAVGTAPFSSKVSTYETRRVMLRDCVSVLFEVLDAFINWKRQHQVYVLSNAARNIATPANTSTKLKNDNTVARAKESDPKLQIAREFFNALPYLELAEAAHGIGDHHRAYLYYEIAWRHSRSNGRNGFSEIIGEIVTLPYKIFGALGEADAIAGINAAGMNSYFSQPHALNTEACVVGPTHQLTHSSLTEQISYFRSQGMYQECSACYESLDSAGKENEDGDELSIHVGRIDTFLALQQSKCALHYIKGLGLGFASTYTAPVLMPYHHECLRRLNQWDELDKLLLPEKDSLVGKSCRADNALTAVIDNSKSTINVCKVSGEAPFRGNNLTSALNLNLTTPYTELAKSLCILRRRGQRFVPKETTAVDFDAQLNSLIRTNQNQTIAFLNKAETAADLLNVGNVRMSRAQNVAQHDYLKHNYQTSVNFHVAMDLNLANTVFNSVQTAIPLSSQVISTDFEHLLSDKLSQLFQTYQDRIQTTAMNFSVREPVLSVHRSIVFLASQIVPSSSSSYLVDRLNRRLGQLYLESAKLARKFGQIQTAQYFLINAEKYDLPNTYIQKAKWLRSKGSIEQSIAVLKRGLETLLIHRRQSNPGTLNNNNAPSSTVESSFEEIMEIYNNNNNSNCPRDKSNETDIDRRKILYKMFLLLGRYTEESAQFDTKAIRQCYRKAIQIDPSREKCYLYLAQHFDKLYQSTTASSVTATGRNTIQRNQSTGAATAAAQLKQREEAVASRDVAYFALRFYGQSLRNGHKYLYESLPRLLSIWLDFTAAHPSEDLSSPASKRRAVPTSPAQTYSVDYDARLDLNSIKLTGAGGESNVNQMNRYMRDLIIGTSSGATSLPSGLFLVAYPQLISRICHPNPETWELLKTCLAQIMVRHTHRAFWMSVAVLKSSHPLRSERCRNVFAQALEISTKIGSGKSNYNVLLAKYLNDANKLTDKLLDVSNHEVEQPGYTTLQMSLHFRNFKKLFEDTNFSCILLPLQSQMSIHPDDFKNYGNVLPLTSTNSINEKGDMVTVKRFKRSGSSDFNSNLAGSTNYNTKLPPVPFPAVDGLKPSGLYIVKIEEDIEVLPSLQRPKKILFRASDGKCYPMLCKPKDDLRKDFRLMEFNGLVNRCLTRNLESSRRSLAVKTYSVIPLNEECGLIEWVPNVQPYRNILHDIYRESDKVMTGRELIEHRLPANAPLDRKLAVYRDKLLPFYSPPVFHKWFLRTFTEPSSWYKAIMVYSKSLAVMSMVGYVLGLGDRHGENILLDKTNGEVLHVDFNCLFNKGLAFEYPEKVEFRLTNNLIDAMGPLGYEGIFRKSCEITLNVMRGERNLLMSVLKTFIHDPLLEWNDSPTGAHVMISHASNSIKPSQNVTTGLLGAPRNGNSKNLKLQCDTPYNRKAQIHVDNIDLRLKGYIHYRANLEEIGGIRSSSTHHHKTNKTSSKQQHSNKNISNSTGSNIDSIPSSIGSALSISGQVDYLIRESTDENLLCQMYIGWAPFL